MTPRVSSRRAAQLLGISTKTLANWRCEGRGPGGWARISKTFVIYPLESVEQFIRDRAAENHRPASDKDEVAVAP